MEITPWADSSPTGASGNQDDIPVPSGGRDLLAAGSDALRPSSYVIGFAPAYEGLFLTGGHW